MINPSCLLLLGTACLLFPLNTLFSQGSLAPPGAPAPTMKTLAQIEPRFPVSFVPTNLTQPGSYYLTATLTTVTNGGGITINANDVSLDLSGFALVGAPGGASGIDVLGNRTNLWIGNGVVRQWGGNGIAATTAYNSRFERLRFSNNGGAGLSVGGGCSVVDCSAQACNSGGFYNVGSGVLFQACTAQTNGLDGFYLGTKGTLVNCIAAANAVNGIYTGDSAAVQNCTAGNNGGNGVVLGQSSTVQDCAINNNSLNGLLLNSSYMRVTRCSIIRNELSGISSTSGGQTVVGCMVNGNRNHGIFLNSCCNLITDCSVVENYFDGITGGDAGQITGNFSRYNGRGTNGAGIRLTSNGNRVENNTVGGNTVGIMALSSGNLIIKNYAQGNVTNYHILGTQKIGPIITTGGTITNENAWSNFSD